MTYPVPPSDPGRTIDWGRTSVDYAAFRSGPPASFYERLRAAGVGLPGQRVLDLGTGTGVIARELARRGCRCSGVDISAEQVAAARRLAAGEGLDVVFAVAHAEDTGLAASTVDVVTANQCWFYFERDRAVAEVRRVLAPAGILVTSHFSWLPREDELARRTEELVLRHNPAWTAADFDGIVPARPAWIGDDFQVAAWFAYDEPVPFTRATWRGRIRACRGVGASMTAEEVGRFDLALAEMLEHGPGEFTVLHRIDAHVLRPRVDPGLMRPHPGSPRGFR